MLLLLVLIATVVRECGSASCGSSGIPFRLEVLPSGSPVLGCASPTCFGAENGGRNFMHDSQFGAGPDGDDGFFRRGDLDVPRRRFNDAPSQLADCPTGYSSSSCTSPTSWVGGIQVENDGTLGLQCCNYEGMKYSSEVGRVVVRPGEVYSGGEVIRDGRQTAFDLVKNLKRIDTDDGGGAYEVTVSRMSCLPDPVELINQVSIDQQGEIPRILDKVSEVSGTDVGEARETVVSGTDTDQVVQVGEAVVPVQTGGGTYSGGGYYYPVAGGVPACFARDTVVVTPSGPITIDKLRVGDFVMTVEKTALVFTEVLSFLHRLPEENVTYVWVRTSAGDSLKLTPLHFIYITDCDNPLFNVNLVYAEELRVGHCLYATHDHLPPSKVRVTWLSVVKEEGAYAPMTASGDLISSNIYASCHNLFRSNTLTHTFFYWMHYLESSLRTMFISDPLSESTVKHLPFGTHFLLSVLEYIVPLKY